MDDMEVSAMNLTKMNITELEITKNNEYNNKRNS